MNNTRLSIIIPLFNGKAYIDDTVTALRQIHSFKEILIVDDESTDGSYEYCKNRWSGCSDIRVLHQEHGGITKARNHGLREAVGKWILFSDQDDVIVPETIDEAIQWAEREKLDGVLWSTEHLYEDGRIKSCDTVFQQKILTGPVVQAELLCDMLMNTDNRNVSYIGHLWGGIYNKELVDKADLSFQRYVDAEDDYLFVMGFLCCAFRVGLTPSVGYKWRCHQKSETYRQKYIDNIIERYHQLYCYIDKITGRFDIEATVRERYECYRIQNVILRSIENSFQCLHLSIREQQIIRKLYRDNKILFQGDSIAKLGGRQRRIYCLLQHGMFMVAGAYVYVDSVYRMCRRRITGRRK